MAEEQDKENLEEAYRNMKNRHMLTVSILGIKYDPLLAHQKDERYCQAVFSIPKVENCKMTDKFDKLIKLLGMEESGITYYINNREPSQGMFHFTFFQQLGFADFREWTNKQKEEHYFAFKEILEPSIPIGVTYWKLILTQNSLVLCGYPTRSVNKLRQRYRDYCVKNELELKEPYHNDIVHSTIFRFTKPVPDIYQFLSKYEEFLNDDVYYGIVNYELFYMGKATLKLNYHEISMDYTFYSVKNDSTVST